jgi:hypothetical protein
MREQSAEGDNNQPVDDQSPKQSAKAGTRVFLDGIRRGYTPEQIQGLCELHEETIEALINRFPESPPAWVHRAVDSLLSLNELMHQEVN